MEAIDWTSLNSDNSFLLLGPGTAVTKEGVAGSCLQFNQTSIKPQMEFWVQTSIKRQMESQEVTCTTAWLISLLAPWSHGCPGRRGEIKPVTKYPRLLQIHLSREGCPSWWISRSEDPKKCHRIWKSDTLGSNSWLQLLETRHPAIEVRGFPKRLPCKRVSIAQGIWMIMGRTSSWTSWMQCDVCN